MARGAECLEGCLCLLNALSYLNGWRKSRLCASRSPITPTVVAASRKRVIQLLKVAHDHTMPWLYSFTRNERLGSLTPRRRNGNRRSLL
ncbi:hypothetical protein AOQ84DRAFT_352051 [Glonium stellatum]|uniref:Uncharacterized protein n=1 Tax=Glonium stellatum TaxID=574774 RepID=A0A8E2FBB8_9PEZI|nr:hypothetical protein AOQ84DRAFT_352051 [Glonium stellatum]